MFTLKHNIHNQFNQLSYILFRFLSLLWILPFFSAKAMASSFEENESTMLDKGSALKHRGKKTQLK